MAQKKTYTWKGTRKMKLNESFDRTASHMAGEYVSFNTKKGTRKMKTIKWYGTALCLVGIALTSFNIYPLNILVGFIGSLLWSIAGYMEDDLPLLVVEMAATLIYFCGIVTYLLLALRSWGAFL